MEHWIQTVGLLSFVHQPFHLSDDPVSILLNIDDVVGILTSDEGFQVANLGVEIGLNPRNLCGLPQSFNEFVPRT